MSESALSKLLKKDKDGDKQETYSYDSATDSSSPDSNRLSYFESVNVRKHHFESPSNLSKFITINQKFQKSFTDIKISKKEKWEFANYLIDQLGICHLQIVEINKFYKKVKFDDRIYTDEYINKNLKSNEANIKFLSNFLEKFDEIVKSEELSILPNGKPARNKESLEYFFQNLKSLIVLVLTQLKKYISEYKRMISIKENTKTLMDKKRLLLGGNKKIDIKKSKRKKLKKTIKRKTSKK